MLWLIGSLSRIFRLPFDPQLIRQQFPPPYSRVAVLNALQALDFKVGERNLDNKTLASLEQLPFPAVAFLRPQPAAQTADKPDAEQDKPSAEPDSPEQPQAEEAPVLTIPVLLIKASGGQLMFFRAGSESPETIAIDEFFKLFRTDILLIARKEQNASEGEEAASSPKEPEPFGFRWFIPELMKHKRIWRDVLIASLAIQLVGLVTPLFTQVIIDKVVVHQTQSTLIAIAVGLVMFMLFSSAMTWLRQYFVLHTGNRIDAVLGSHVFRHMLHLPVPYFEQRPTGTLVARLYGVETVREFITGAAVSLLLDFPFLLIFLAVMFWYSWQLSLIALLLMSLITLASLLVTPALRERLNEQFMLGAKNQAFVTEYIAGMETVNPCRWNRCWCRNTANIWRNISLRVLPPNNSPIPSTSWSMPWSRS